MSNIVYQVTYNDGLYTAYLGTYTTERRAKDAVNAFIHSRGWEHRTLDEWVSGSDTTWTDFEEGPDDFTIDLIKLDVQMF